jgi:hypothetical protein
MIFKETMSGVSFPVLLILIDDWEKKQEKLLQCYQLIEDFGNHLRRIDNE